MFYSNQILTKIRLITMKNLITKLKITKNILGETAKVKIRLNGSHFFNDIYYI